MSSTKLSRLVLYVGCAVSMVATSAFAQLPQTYDKKVYFTFSGPVEIPGATLPAGKYLFHLSDPDSSRQVLQVQSADGKKVYAQFFSSPVERAKASDDPEVRFMETAVGAPSAIATLWYAGERTGRELIYPREQALRIAKATSQAVLTTKAASTKAEEAKTGDLTHVSPSGADTQIAQNTAEPSGRLQRGDVDRPAGQTPPAAQSTPAPRVSTPVATAGQAPAARTSPARSRLPQTAGNTSFMLMLAVGLFTATVALRLARTGWM